MKAFDKLQIIGYETVKNRKILNLEAKAAFGEFLNFVKSLNFKLRTLFFIIDWTLLFTVSKSWVN